MKYLHNLTLLLLLWPILSSCNQKATIEQEEKSIDKSVTDTIKLGSYNRGLDILEKAVEARRAMSKEEKEVQVNRLKRSELMKALQIVESSIKYNGDYEPEFHFTIVNKSSKTVIAFAIGYSTFVDGEIHRPSIIKYKQRIRPNESFTSKLLIEPRLRDNLISELEIEKIRYDVSNAIFDDGQLLVQLGSIENYEKLKEHLR